MKNLFKSMMLVAAAAMGFTACSKDATEEVAPETKGATEIITISTDITRTTLNADRTQLTWVAGDQFAVYTDQGTKNTPVTYTEGAVNFDLEVAAGSQTVYAYYPYYDRQNTQYDQTSVSMYVTSTQKQKEAGVFDGDANDYVMVAKGAIDAEKHVGLTFKPVACALAFNIYGGQTEEKVESVTFDPGVVCAGQHYMDITVDNPVYTAANGSATSVTVTLENPFEAVGEKPADPKAFANQVYAVVARKAYEGAVFTVKTSLNTYTFKTASTLDLTTDFFTMNLNLTKGETPAPVVTKTYAKVTTAPADWTGTYIIAYKDNVMTGELRDNTQYLGKDAATAYDEAGNTITCSSAYEITIEKSATDGYYTLKNSAGKYIGINGNSTGAKIADTPSTDDFLWALDIAAQTITNKAQSPRNIRYNGSTDYRVYSGTSSGSAPDFYTISGPRVSVAETEFTIKSDDTAEHTFTCTVSGEGAELANVTMTQDEESKSWLTASYADGTVTYKAAANETDAPRTATLTLAIADGNSVEITVTQAAPIKKLVLTLQIEGTVASWSTEPASPVKCYNYWINQDKTYVQGETNVQITSLDLSTLGLETGTYTLYVQAEGDGIQTTYSNVAQGEFSVVKSETKKYVKVTATPTDWSGDYLIVYEAGKVAFNGNLSTLDAVENTISVTINNNEIVSDATTDSAKFTIKAISDGYSIQSNSKNYIYQTSYANGLKTSTTTTGLNTITLNSDGTVSIQSSNTTLKFNKASDQMRFRYYKTGQQAITLYKLQ